MAAGTLAAAHDAALLDLDGTVYEGGRAIPGAREALAEAGLPMLFITNNASRAPGVVAAQLRDLGYAAEAGDVMTSAQAAIEMAREVVDPGAAVLVLGADSFRELAADAGYRVVSSADDAPAAVLHGHSPATGWAELSEAALAIRAGAAYLASNLDTTLPVERGLLVGNGSMVAAVTSATGVTPRSAGKPGPAMFRRGAARLGATRPLAIGDRLNTDIAGGNNAGQATLMVVTGVSGHRETLLAAPGERPRYIGATMAALNEPAEHAAPGPQAGFTVTRDDSDPATLVLAGGDPADPRLADPGRAAVAALLTAAGLAWAPGAAPVTGIRAAEPGGPAAAALAAWR